MESTNEDIRKWLHKQSDWLQDASERLLKQGSLSSTDVNELVARVKTADGQRVTGHRTFDSLTQPSTAGLDLRLRSISGLTGIEGLAPRRPLTFGPANLTVVYGHNGSGKSSYARLLKKVTGKPRALDLKPDVFQAVPVQGQCHFTYELDVAEMSTEWLSNAAPIAALRAVDIFDSDEAGHYLSSENPAAYTPPVVALFENLALACDQVKAQLQDEQGKLVKALPAMPHEYATTAAGKNYSSLKFDVAEATLSAFLTWTSESEIALTQATERLKTTDHAALARQKRTKKTQVLQVATGLQQAFAAYSSTALEHLRTLRKAAQTKRQIATEAAKVESAQLDHVGSATWRAMWEAARKYSQEAYPAKPFPVTDAARCVLCHQELSPVAQERLQAFESFVLSKLEAEAAQAESAYTQAKNQLPVAWDQKLVNTQAEAAGLTVDESWPTYLRGFWLGVENARTAMLSSLDQTWEERTIDRLVQLSETRQVIVFTHRLSFMGLIGEKSEDMTCVHIRHEPWGAGETGDVPLYGKKPDPALNHLLNTRLTQARKAHQDHGWDDYYPLGKSICSDFRILLERVVEFVMLADVVQRHRREVHTKNKIQHLAKITSADCELIEDLMTK